MAFAKLLKSLVSGGWQEIEDTDTIDKKYLDPTMAGNGFLFNLGVLTFKPKTNGGLVADSLGTFINFDGTTIGISGGKVAVLKSYSEKGFYKIHVDAQTDIEAEIPEDTLTLVEGDNMHIQTNPAFDTISFHARPFPEISFNSANNQIIPQNITGFSFDSSTRSFFAFVSVTIKSSITSLYDSFNIYGINKDTSWEIATTHLVGDTSGYVFSITSSGQVQYTSLDTPGYTSSVIKFRLFTTVTS